MRTRQPLLLSAHRLSAHVVALVALVGFAAGARAAGKSNQVRPTPSPIGNPAMAAGEWALSPQLVYANYSDNADSGFADYPLHYDMHSMGLLLQAQYGILDALHATVVLEAYRKFGTITGPSPAGVQPGNTLAITEAHALGFAFKVGAQVDLRLYKRGAADVGKEPEIFDFSIYLFGRGLADIFRQDQKEPLYQTSFAEDGFTYRAGAALHAYLGAGFFVAPFGGIEGVFWSGERIDTSVSENTTTPFSGSEPIYPFVGGDILWAPALFGTSYSQAISLAAIIALAAEDESGYGGELFTLSLGYTFEF